MCKKKIIDFDETIYRGDSFGVSSRGGITVKTNLRPNNSFNELTKRLNEFLDGCGKGEGYFIQYHSQSRCFEICQPAPEFHPKVVASLTVHKGYGTNTKMKDLMTFLGQHYFLDKASKKTSP